MQGRYGLLRSSNLLSTKTANITTLDVLVCCFPLALYIGITWSSQRVSIYLPGMRPPAIRPPAMQAEVVFGAVPLVSAELDLTVGTLAHVFKYNKIVNGLLFGGEVGFFGFGGWGWSGWSR